MLKDIRIKPCPFCGIAPKIQRVDTAGNFLPDDYEERDDEITRMILVHPVKWNECPIATNDSVGTEDWLGNIEYDNVDEIISFWNRKMI